MWTRAIVAVVALYIIVLVTQNYITGTDTASTFSKVAIPLLAAASAVLTVLKTLGGRG